MTFEDHPALRKLVDAQEGLTRLSLMIDGHNIANGKDPEAMLWGRVAKVAEEGGEAVTALIGITNQNPRKGTYSSFSELDKELLKEKFETDELKTNQGFNI